MTTMSQKAEELVAPYLGDASEEVSHAALSVSNLTQEYEAGRLTAAEYQDLINDALDLSKIDALMETQDEKQRAARIFDIMRQALGIITSLPL